MNDAYAVQLNNNVIALNATLTKILNVLDKMADSQAKIEAHLQALQAR